MTRFQTKPSIGQSTWLGLCSAALALSFAGQAAVAEATPPITVHVAGRSLAIDPLTSGLDNPGADIVVDGGVHVLPPGINLYLHARSLKLLHNATIVTGGDRVSIHVRYLVAQGALIEAFDGAHRAAASAPPGQPGLPGSDAGALQIKARALNLIGDGSFVLDLSGQDGGTGGAGQAGIKGATGAKGSDGAAYPDPLVGGPRMKSCLVQPGPGGAGGPGGQGAAGASGGRGGNGGLVDVMIHRPFDSKRLRVIVQGGHGGSGGAGGLGGAGGDGGPIGFAPPPCVRPSAGPAGPAGPPGQVGLRGSDGAAGQLVGGDTWASPK